MLFGVLLKLPAEPHGQAEAWVHLPLVLRKECVVAGRELEAGRADTLVVGGVVFCDLAGNRILRQVKVRDVIAQRGVAAVAESAVLVEEVGDPVVSVEVILSELDGVVTMDPDDGVGELPAALVG